MVSPPVVLFLVSSSHVPLKSGFAVDLVFCAATIAHKKRMEVKQMGADKIDFRMMVFEIVSLGRDARLAHYLITS